jgi:hypothetical protein
MIRLNVCCLSRLIELKNSMRDPILQITYEPRNNAYFIKVNNNNGVVIYEYILIEPTEEELEELRKLK